MRNHFRIILLGALLAVCAAQAQTPVDTPTQAPAEASGTPTPEGAAKAPEASPEIKATDAFATVNDSVITWGEYGGALQAAARQKFYHGQPPQAEIAKLQREVADKLVNRILLLEEAKRRGIKPDREAIDKEIAQYDAVGSQPEFDVLRARVARDNQRTNAIARRADQEVAYIQLKQLLNLPVDAPVTLATTLVDTTFGHTPSLARLVSEPVDTAVNSRLAVRQASEAVIAQEGLLKAARSQQIPQLFVTSQYGNVGYPSNLDPLSPTYFTNWNVGVGLQFPIFTGGRIKGDKLAAEAGLSEARARQLQAERVARVDARTALASLEAAEAAWGSSDGTVREAQRAYEIATSPLGDTGNAERWSPPDRISQALHHPPGHSSVHAFHRFELFYGGPPYARH